MHFGYRISIRSLSYFKIMAETMLVTVDCHKQQALWCSESKGYQSCPPKLSSEEDFVGLASINYEENQQSTQSNRTSKSEEMQPLLSKQKDLSTDQNPVDEFLFNLSFQRSLAWENPEQPMLFVPGKILHLEVPTQYRTLK